MEEVWVELEDWPDYLISNMGNVWSKLRGRLLKQSVDTKGYFRVNLQRDGVWKNVAPHRLVAFAFISGYFDGAHVNHKDGVKTNNVSENLEWVTHAENMKHARDTGLIHTGPRWRTIERVER